MLREFTQADLHWRRHHPCTDRGAEAPGVQRGSGCPSLTGVCSGDRERTPPAPRPLLQQQGWADLAAVPQFPTRRHGPTPHPTLVLAGPERPGEETSW